MRSIPSNPQTDGAPRSATWPLLIACLLFTGVTGLLDRIFDLSIHFLSFRGQVVFSSIVQAWVLFIGMYLIYRLIAGFSDARLFVHVIILAGLGFTVGSLGVVTDEISSPLGVVTGASILFFGFTFRKNLFDLVYRNGSHPSRALQPGDWVIVFDSEFNPRIQGSLVSLEGREAELIDEEGRKIVIPIRLLQKSAYKNVPQDRGTVRFGTTITLDASVPVERGLRILEAGAISSIGPDGPAAEPAPDVTIKETTELGVIYTVNYSVNPVEVQKGTAHSTLLQHIIEHVQHAGLSLVSYTDEGVHAVSTQRFVDLESVEGRMETLSRIEPFDELDEEALRELAGGMKIQLFRKGQPILNEGEIGHSMFVLVEGLLQVFKDDPENGTNVQVGRINPRYFFGEMSLLTGQPRSATIVAVTDSVALEISRESIRDLITMRPEISLKLGMVAAERRMKNIIGLGHQEVKDLQRQTAQMVSHILAEMKAFFGSPSIA